MVRLMVLLVLLAAAHPAGAEQRVALVIGNGAYAQAPLNNPTNDARLIRDTLCGLGFQVQYLENADGTSTIRAIQTMITIVFAENARSLLNIVEYVSDALSVPETLSKMLRSGGSIEGKGL